MTHNLLLVACIALAVTLIALLAWLKPLYDQAKRASTAPEEAERRVRQEMELKLNAMLLEAKEDALRIRERAETEAKEKLVQINRNEERLTTKDESLEQRRVQLEDREQSLKDEAKRLATLEESIGKKVQLADEELRKVADLSKDQARDLYLSQIEGEFAEIGARRAKEIEAQAILEAEKKAKKTVLDVIQRSVVDYVTEATLAVVELPSEDMKGRIIGREGRNIRAFEQVTGVDLIIDETPEAVVISCFDPVRRETARLALMNLMVDGRILGGLKSSTRRPKLKSIA